ncbi:TetR family transcriptional regulator [Aeromicrobium sp.]|uniref:TetR/AcrR family transcriptional regulator n=1 Tax=Aeromicrobium sp. TaxID=1871063 RepID=UPI0030C173D1
MVTRASLSQERSRLRRDELLAAAIELFAEGGSRAITHRAVAARAGLPSATTTYYFESIDELIREALGSHIDQWTRDLEALSAVDLDIEVSLDDASQFISHIFSARGPEVAALELAIFLAAARAPELRHAAAHAIRAFEGLTLRMLNRVGVHDADMLAASIVTLIAGTAVRRQSGLHTEHEEARLLTAAIRNLVAAHALGADGVDRTLAKLSEKAK